MKTIMISPTDKASQRTKNRIRENGPFFSVDSPQPKWMVREKETEWLLRAGTWVGWLPRSEFHVKAHPMRSSPVSPKVY